MSATRGPLRAMVITGAVFPEHLEVWRGCREAGADVTIVGTDLDFYRGKWPWHPRPPDDLDCVVLQPRSPRVSKGHLWWSYPGLASEIEKRRPDIVHVLSEPWGLLVADALIQRRRARVDAAVCAHGADNLYHHGGASERVLRRAILRWSLPKLDGFVSWNREGIDLAHVSGLPDDVPTAVIPAVVPAADEISPPEESERRRLRDRFGLPHDEVVVGFFGRLIDEKGIGDLMGALTRIERPPFLAVWGAGALEGDLEEAIGSGALKGLYGGSLDFATVIDAMRACDIVAIPSKRTPTWMEQFGRVALEAMYAGCAVVGYRSGALPDVVGDAGMLVDEGDITGLARCLERLSTDHGLRRALANKGRSSMIQAYHPEALGRSIVDFWTELL